MLRGASSEPDESAEEEFAPELLDSFELDLADEELLDRLGTGERLALPCLLGRLEVLGAIALLVSVLAVTVVVAAVGGLAVRGRKVARRAGSGCLT